MKLKLTFSLMILSLVTLLFSCSENQEVEPDVTETTYSGMSDFYAKNGATFQTFQVNSITGDTITGSKGTIIRIAANSFVDANNQPVSGMITLKLKEIYSKKDMLLSGITTTSWDQVIYSAGMFKLEAFLNDDQVYFSYPKPFNAFVPSANFDPSMNLYRGIMAGTSINWSWDSLSGVLNYNSSQLPYGYFFQSIRNNWINCDALAPFPNIVVNVMTQNNPNPDSTITFVWFNSISAIRNLPQVSANMFSSTFMKPVQCAFISMTVSGGKIYAGLLNVPSASNGSSYTIPMQHMTDQEFKDAIEALN